MSTTPVYDRARFYATRGGKVEGYVYTIDRSLLNQHEIRVFVVADIVPCPSVPEDLEVILVAADGGKLPPEVVVSVDHVPAQLGMQPTAALVYDERAAAADAGR